MHNTERRHGPQIVVSPALWDGLLHATYTWVEELPYRCRVRSTWEVRHITSFVNTVDIKYVGIENCMQCVMHVGLKSKKHNYVQLAKKGQPHFFKH